MKYQNSIVIDFIATTFDIIKDRVYVGGVISGINLSISNLNKFTLLPILNLKSAKKKYGKNTQEALNAGFIWGYQGLINNIIDKISLKRRKNFKIILTGGYAKLFKRYINGKTEVDQNITIKEYFKSFERINMKNEKLIFCPLGGSGEIGMNMNLYAYGSDENQKWIIVDMGVTFADDSIPGVDLIFPDAGFIVDKKDDLLGIVLTHAHEDHIGSVAHIWPRLKCKIYATPLLQF